MINIKLIDQMVAHEEIFFKKELRDLNLIRGDIEKNDLTLYTDQSLHLVLNDNKSKIKIGLIFESSEITPDCYNFLKNNFKYFDLILTFDKELLELDERFKMNVYGTTWLNKIYRKIYKKKKLCSLITSKKCYTTGHKLRYDVINILNNNKKNIDLYGGLFTPLQLSQTKPWTIEHDSQHITNHKIKGLKDYMFSFVIENCKKDYYFTEKIIDAFLSGTVPIYYGCPSICNFFNEKGIIHFDTAEEALNILNSLDEDKYNNMLPYIEENFEKAKKYTNFKFNEQEILNICK
jgi:hypothetical protein